MDASTEPFKQSAIPLRALGATGIRFPALGVGTNRWGIPGEGADALIPVFGAALDAGANLFDTAAGYGFGASERSIGECMRHDPRPALIVSKIEPFSTRASSRSWHKALEGSLTRLGLPAIDLYLIHFPITLQGIASMAEMLAEVAKSGKVRAVGVSNFSAKQMVIAADRLERHGIPLAANEVNYSLFHRAPERNGVLEACRKLDATLIAYRPLASGQYRREGQALDRTLATIAHARGKTVPQVALNWLLCKDERIIAIPGTTNAMHLRENAGAAGWTLTEEELAALDNS